ncbi:MAG: hypothetical protein M0Z33_06680 [Actinomycetota bacterium]|nr:hypothetical protein [Actinomycetota bacterium]
MSISADELERTQGVSWYVSRRVDVESSDLSEVSLPSEVSGGGGVTLVILGPRYVDDERYRSFSGVLTLPGIVGARMRVEVDLNPYSSRHAEIGLRPAGRAPRYRVAPERYFDAAWRALDALAEAVSPASRAERANDEGGAAA